MSYMGDSVSTYIELQGTARDARVLVETEDGECMTSEIVEMLRIIGVDRRAFRTGARFYVSISYSYPND
jgi:hypothetical protein